MAEITAAGLLRAGAPTTIRTYQTGIFYLSAWHSLRFGQPLRLPVPAAAVLQYIVDHTTRVTADGPQGGLPPAIDEALVAAGTKKDVGVQAFETMRVRLAALSALHTARRLADPFKDPVVVQFLRRLSSEYERRGERHAPVRPALTEEPLDAMLATCDDTLFGVRDRALLLFAWASGGRKPSQVSAAGVLDLTRTGNTFLFRPQRKGSGAKDLPAEIALDGRVGDALCAWIDDARIVDGPLFRPLRGKIVQQAGLSPSAINVIVKNRAALAGLSTQVSASSMRLGFVAHSMATGTPLAETVTKLGLADITRVMNQVPHSQPWAAKPNDDTADPNPFAEPD